MEPITHDEIFMAVAAGEYEGELPEPVTRTEFYWQKIAQRIDAGGSVSPDAVQTAVDNYLDENSAVFNTSAEITEVLNG